MNDAKSRAIEGRGDISRFVVHLIREVDQLNIVRGRSHAERVVIEIQRRAAVGARQGRIVSFLPVRPPEITVDAHAAGSGACSHQGQVYRLQIRMYADVQTVATGGRGGRGRIGRVAQRISGLVHARV